MRVDAALAPHFTLTAAERMWHDLCVRHPVAETGSEELKRLVRFTSEDATRIETVAPTVASRMRSFAQHVAARLREHEDARPALAGEPRGGGLEDTLVAWQERLFGGVYDDPHFVETAAVGRDLARRGLPHRYVPVAMSLVRSALVGALLEVEDAGARVAADALCRLLDVELAVVLEGYRDETEAQGGETRRIESQRIESLGTLAAGLAHEIRNPLNGASLHLAVVERALASTPALADASESVKVVNGEIQRLARLVTDFLAYAQPRAPDAKPTDVAALCERVAAAVRAAAGRLPVTITTELPSSTLVVPADAARIEHALSNLLHNAVEALGPSGGRVVLRAHRDPSHVTFEVEDDGPGLPPSDPPIFHAFFSTKATGTGLGLSIVQRVVTDHQGTVDCESRPGRTCFRIKLPVTPGEVDG